MLVFVRASRYDAGTGQFTQQDPIGIAGGANVYGFAGGDPVNFGDPFGLWPDPLKLAVGTTKFLASGIGQVILAAACSMGCVEHASGDLQITGASLPLPVGRLVPRGPGTTAAGQTAGGRATDEHGNALGPSGKPQVNEVNHATRKAAKDAARQEGMGAPVKHPSPSKGEPHFHPTGKDGEKLPASTHHNYPP